MVGFGNFAEIDRIMAMSKFLNRFKKTLLVTLGLVCLGLGIIGYILPGLPGTIWLIIAATLFVRSSDRLYGFVINHRLFGQQVKEYLETGQMRLKTKFVSLIFMWTFSVSSVFLAPYGWLFDIPVLLLAATGTAYIISRPTKKSST